MKSLRANGGLLGEFKERVSKRGKWMIFFGREREQREPERFWRKFWGKIGGKRSSVLSLSVKIRVAAKDTRRRR